MPKNLEDAVASHYGRTGLVEAILQGLEAAGANLDALKPQDLAPVDEFHTAGRQATLKALERTPIQAGMHVLDAGSGIGGTARCLAADFDCRVTGIDLTPEYVAVSRSLTERLGLSGKCTFHLGSVTAMPFEDAIFDAAVSFHVAMNVENRRGFYAELRRVLRSGAPLCLFDVMKGPTPDMVYPVPWAETAATSFLKTRDETVELLRNAGFEIERTESLRNFAIDYFNDVFARAAKTNAPPPFGLHLLTGANTAAKFSNYFQALKAHQIEPVVVVATRN